MAGEELKILEQIQLTLVEMKKESEERWKESGARYKWALEQDKKTKQGVRRALRYWGLISFIIGFGAGLLLGVALGGL